MEDVLCPIVFPVHGIDVPLHRVTAGFLDEPDRRVVIVSIFKTKQRRFRIGKAINSLREIFQCERLFPDGKRCLRCPQTADIVSGVVNRTEQLRIVFCPGVGNEKGGVHIFFFQNFQKLLHVLCTVGAVEGQRDFFLVGFDTANRHKCAVYRGRRQCCYRRRGEKNARAGKGEDAEQKQGSLECRRAGETVQRGKNGIVAQFILNQMNEISDHEDSCRIFVTTYERRKRKISISQKFHNLFVCFLVHYKDRLQAFGCRTEEK